MVGNSGAGAPIVGGIANTNLVLGMNLRDRLSSSKTRFSRPRSAVTRGLILMIFGSWNVSKAGLFRHVNHTRKIRLSNGLRTVISGVVQICGLKRCGP